MSNIADGLAVAGQESPEKPEGVISSAEDFVASLNRDLGFTDDETPPAAEVVPAPAAPAAPAGEAPAADDGTPPVAPAEGEMIPKTQYDELQSLMGRMSNELGELRKAVQPAEEQQPAEQYAPPPPITSELVEQIEDLLLTQSGEDVAYWALTQAPHLYETVLDSWADQGGSAARRAAEFNMRYNAALASEQERVAAEEQQEFQATLATALDAEVTALAPTYGLTPNTPETDQLLADVIGDMPPSVQRLVVSKDPAERRDGLVTVLQVAQSRAAVPTTADNAAGAAARAAALATVKGAAAIGGGSLRPAAPPNEGGGATKPDFLEQLQEAILEVPSTSVASGLTFGTGQK